MVESIGSNSISARSTTAASGNESSQNNAIASQGTPTVRYARPYIDENTKNLIRDINNGNYSIENRQSENANIDWGHNDRDARALNAADGLYGEDVQRATQFRLSGGGGGKTIGGGNTVRTISSATGERETIGSDSSIQSKATTQKVVKTANVMTSGLTQQDFQNIREGNYTIENRQSANANIDMGNNEEVASALNAANGSYDDGVSGRVIYPFIASSQTGTVTPEMINTTDIPKLSALEAYRGIVKSGGHAPSWLLVGSMFKTAETLTINPKTGDFAPVFPTPLDMLPISEGETRNTPAFQRMMEWEEVEGSGAERANAGKDAFITIGSAAAGFGAGLALNGTKAGVKVLSAIKNTGKTGAKTAGGLIGLGTLGNVGYDNPITEKTSSVSETLSKSSTDMINSDNQLVHIGGYLSAIPLGVASGVVGAVGGGAAAINGGYKLITGNSNQNIMSAGMNAVTGFIDYAKEGFSTNPLFTAGEIGVITGAVGKGVKTYKTANENRIVRQAQGDIEASFAKSVGLNGKDTKRGFLAAGNVVKIVKKIDVPLKDSSSTGIRDLTMFSDLSQDALRNIDKTLADGNVVSYGTSSNVSYGLGFRKSSDYDASISEKTADKTIGKLLEIFEPYGGVRKDLGILRKFPTGGEAHAFDMHYLDNETAIGKYLNGDIPIGKTDNTKSNPTLTSTFEFLPESIDEYKTIRPEGSDGVIYVEPLSSAYSRKYKATYFPKTDKTANLNEKKLIPPKRIKYETRINPDIYTKDTNLNDLDEKVKRTIPVSGVSFTHARILGTMQNLGVKVRNLSTIGTGEISKKINYPLEDHDSHRMKDSLDLIGITWEYKTHIIDENVKNPIKRAIYKQRVSSALDTMLNDDVLRTQVKRGINSKLLELNLDFAQFLKQKGLLSDRQYRKVERTTEKGREVERTTEKGDKQKIEQKTSAYITGTPEISRVVSSYDYNARPKQYSTNANQKLKPYNPKQNKKSYETPEKLNPYSINTRYGGETRTGSSPYNISITSQNQSGIYQIPSNIKNYKVNDYYLGGNISKKNRISENNIRRNNKRKSDDRRTGVDYYSAARRGRIEHLSIVDPAEMMGIGSMTNRKQADVTMYKDKLYMVNGIVTTRKPRGAKRKR